MNDFFRLLSIHFNETKASIWAILLVRLVLPSIIWKHFPPLVKKGKLRLDDAGQVSDMLDIPDGIIVYLTRKCGENVHDRHVGVVQVGD
jgi:hypothetical protein